MAKLYKIEMYILDVNEKFDCLEEIIERAENSTDIHFNPFNVKVTYFEFEDNIPINFSDANVEDYREYFKTKTK